MAEPAGLDAAAARPAAAGRAGLGGDEGLEKDRNRRYESAGGAGRGRRAVPGRRAGRGLPAVGRVPAAEVRPPEPGGAGDGRGCWPSGRSAGVVLLWRENGRTQDALAQAKAHSAAAEERLDLARQAVDEMYTEVAEKWLADREHVAPLQRRFLERRCVLRPVRRRARGRPGRPAQRRPGPGPGGADPAVTGDGAGRPGQSRGGRRPPGGVVRRAPGPSGLPAQFVESPRLPVRMPTRM